jgi:hypothetical protein
VPASAYIPPSAGAARLARVTSRRCPRTAARFSGHSRRIHADNVGGAVTAVPQRIRRGERRFVRPEQPPARDLKRSDAVGARFGRQSRATVADEAADRQRDRRQADPALANLPSRRRQPAWPARVWAVATEVILFLAGTIATMVTTYASLTLGQRMPVVAGRHVLLTGAVLPVIQAAATLVSVLVALDRRLTLLAVSVVPLIALATRLLRPCDAGRLARAARLSGARLRIAIEEHGAGRQLMRVRLLAPGAVARPRAPRTRGGRARRSCSRPQELHGDGVGGAVRGQTPCISSWTRGYLEPCTAVRARCDES